MTIYEIFVLLGGVGLFLFGMTLMSTGLKNAAGEQLRVILEKATGNRFTSILAGLGVTICIQSSSATDVMVIGFVTSGLMGLAPALGVIMGANIGTTITAQITAFNIGDYAPLILFAGAILYLFIKNKTVREIGSVILGFGMLFEGIVLMKSSIAPLAQTQGFIDLITGLSNPLLLVLFGILFTALLQSSSSATVIFQAFAIQGILTYQSAVYLVIGAAIGSVTPNLLAGLTANRAGKRCSILNLIFNVLRAILILIIITIVPQLLTFIQSLSPNDVARQIANTHTIFAIIAVLVLLPFTKYIVKLSEIIVPLHESETRRAANHKLIYLTQLDQVPPAVALSQAHHEVSRMAHLAIENLALSLECFFKKDKMLRDRVLENEESVDYLTGAILDKLVQLRSLNMSDKNLNRLYRMVQIVDDLERISDHAENIVEYEERMASGKAKIFDDELKELQELADLTNESLRISLEIFENENFDLMPKELSVEQQVDDMKDLIMARHIERVAKGECEANGGVIFNDICIDLERCSDHAINLAQALQ